MVSGPVTQFIVCYVIIGHMYNLLKLFNIMDNSYTTSTPAVVRSFSLKQQEDDKGTISNYLHMYASYKGEYGTVLLSVAAMIDSSDLPLMVRFIQTSAENPFNLFSFRSEQVRFFLDILQLFNPLNSTLYEKQKSQAPESPEF